MGDTAHASFGFKSVWLCLVTLLNVFSFPLVRLGYAVDKLSSAVLNWNLTEEQALHLLYWELLCWWIQEDTLWYCGSLYFSFQSLFWSCSQVLNSAECSFWVLLFLFKVKLYSLANYLPVCREAQATAGVQYRWGAGQHCDVEIMQRLPTRGRILSGFQDKSEGLRVD